MLYIKRIRLENWMRYKGVNEIVLEAKAYAVTARDERDPERSNWLGKSSLAEAIYFCLTGKLNGDRHVGADGWITDGEKTGGVILELSDGSIVERERTKSTKLHFTLPGGKPALKEEAQKQLDTLIGLTAEDIPVSSYFMQRKMARLILADPGERLAVASAWFRLGPLETGESDLQKQVSELGAKVEALVQTRAQWARALVSDSQTLKQTARDCAAQVDDVKEVLTVLQDRLSASQRASGADMLVREYESALDEADAIRNRLDADHGELIAEVADTAHSAAQAAITEKSMAASDLRTKRSLASGTFDGLCPVAGIQCPAQRDINDALEWNARLLVTAEETYRTMSARAEKLVREETSAQAAKQERERLEGKYEMLRNRASSLFPQYEEARQTEQGENAEVLRAKINSATAEMAAAHSASREAERQLGELEKATTAIARIDRDLTLLRNEMTARSEAGAIFKSAQRRLAEDALGEIGDKANSMMRECGIGLELEIQWAREANGLARACDACGAPFSASQRVKSCTKCGKARGPHMVNKMDILLSEQSGAAEDLAGAAFQLAAGAWLRADRGSEWSVALIDEPFGQLDAVHRRAFSSHLASMLGSEYGFAQSIVISHSSMINDMMPGRIEVISDGKYSKLKVVS